MNSARAASFELELLRLDRRRREPLFEQLYRSLRDSILDGALVNGARLPSTRDLAERLGVSRTTVVGAFDQLLAEGYLTSSVGSGTFVSDQLPEERQRVDPNRVTTRHGGRKRRRALCPPARFLSEQAGALVRELASLPLQPVALEPFRPGVPALDPFPVKLWSRLRRRQFDRISPQDLSYGDPAGFAPLRRAVADYVRAFRGVRCEDDQVLIVNGTQQAVDITARLVLTRDDPVLYEEPGYRTARSVLEAAGARIVPMPVDEHGARIDVGIARSPRARLAYVTPSHQFPLGVTLSIDRRMELIEWAADRGGLIIEDDYDSEYRYAQRPIPALQGLDDAGHTVYVGSFSKVVFPALSLGYVVVPRPLVEGFRRMLSLVGRPSSLLDQVVLAEFMEQGHFGRHLRRMRKIHQARRDNFVEAADRHLSRWLTVLGVEAGLHCTARLAPGMSDAAVSARLADNGIVAPALSDYYLATAEDLDERIDGLIFGFACATEERARAAVRRMAKIL